MATRLCPMCGKPLTGESQFRFCSRVCSNGSGRIGCPITIYHGVGFIHLGGGAMAQIDVADIPIAKGIPWRRNADGYLVSHRHGPRIAGSKRASEILFLHRIVAGTPKGMKTDHADGDTLNNRRGNLRVVTDGQNAKNKRTRTRTKTSRYKGVHWYARGNKWAAAVMVDYKRHHLGYFTSEDEAAHAYDEAAQRFHGEYAALNFAA